MKIYTKTGDHGRTGLLGGSRVRKDDIRIEAYGSVDELNAAIGVASAESGMPVVVAEMLELIQADLFRIGAQLADPRELDDVADGIAPHDIKRLESHIDRLEEQLPTLKNFILPGGSPVAAVLHLARTICRRAERRTVALIGDEVNRDRLIVMYLNRLSDLLFVMARYSNHDGNTPEVAWTP